MSVLDEIKVLKEDIAKVLDTFNNKMNKEISKPEIYLIQLKERFQFIEWTIKKYNLLFEGPPTSVRQKEIFYCEMGFNIGSEQKESRPVVILQNDRGNSSSNTTIVAPISTHQNCTFFEKDGKKFITFKDESSGKDVTKRLDYYEIPIELDPVSRREIKGYINLAQIKTVSKKRLSKIPIAKITPGNFKQITSQFKKLFG